MTNLINTKWVFNDTLTLNNIIGFNINFTSNGNQYVRLSIEQAMNPNYELKYYQGEDIVDYPYHTGNSWQNAEYKTITITGGADTKNEELYAFLSANATQEMLTKNIVLNKDNIDLFPRTKASLLVEDDGKTPWARADAYVLTPTFVSEKKFTIPQEQYEYLVANNVLTIKIALDQNRIIYGTKSAFTLPDNIFVYGAVAVGIAGEITITAEECRLDLHDISRGLIQNEQNNTLHLESASTANAFGHAARFKTVNNETIFGEGNIVASGVSEARVQEMIDAAIGQALAKEY